MADRTRFVVEVYDPAYNWGLETDPEENWSILVESSFDTFAEAELALPKYTGVYRSVRIKKISDYVVSVYQDGVPVD